MELREWLIILGLALVTLIVIDGVRRLQRQRQVPRLDRAGSEPAGNEKVDSEKDPDEAAREAELSWELPNGGARVVRPAESSAVQPKPRLQRQDHPGPSRVLSEFRRHRHDDEEPEVARPSMEAVSTRQATAAPSDARPAPDKSWHERAEPNSVAPPDATPAAAFHEDEPASSGEATEQGARREPGLQFEAEPTLSSNADASAPEQEPQPLAADPEDHETHDDEERYRLVDFDGMGDSLKSHSRRMGSSVHRLGASLQKSLAERRDNKRQERARKEQERAERQQREEAERQERAQEKTRRDREEAEAKAARNAEQPSAEALEETHAAAFDDDPAVEPHEDEVADVHPVLEKVLRNGVTAEHARQTLSNADEVIVISVMSRDSQGFSGTALLNLMLACGLRYGNDMGIFHRFETDDAESPLQFSMVNVVKPGTFPIQSMDDFTTPGVTLLLPLPSTCDTSAAFEAMVETAMVVVRHLGGELKDENLSVMTAQTVEFARQRVQEFERRHRLSRYQVN
ncbi:cell division protein ZipA [Halomonas sp. 18H]|nr:cell division protein ZipA [Halomonas sp. 18H]MCW4149661.1 cell division protein ZipA [Halomonas sp. 18H]